MTELDGDKSGSICFKEFYSWFEAQKDFAPNKPTASEQAAKTDAEGQPAAAAAPAGPSAAERMAETKAKAAACAAESKQQAQAMAKELQDNMKKGSVPLRVIGFFLGGALMASAGIGFMAQFVERDYMKAAIDGYITLFAALVVLLESGKIP